MQRTITTFLLDGTLDGVQNIFDENGTCELYIIPRAQLDYINSDDQLALPALYILLGTDGKGCKLAYIGETESFRERVKHHDKNKLFWNMALVFVSKNAVINKANVQYLEYLALKQAKLADTFELRENKQTPKCPHLAKHHKAPIDGIFQEIKFITQFAGYNIFEPSAISQPSQSVSSVEPVSSETPLAVVSQSIFEAEEALGETPLTLYLKGRGVVAEGYFTPPKSMTIRKGSIVAATHTSSYAKTKGSIKRQQVFMSLCTKGKDGKFVLTQDYTAKTPSQAAEFCFGRASNGWVAWRTQDGRTLDSAYNRTSHTDTAVCDPLPTETSEVLSERTETIRFYLKGRQGAEAEGYFVSPKCFVILKGSRVAAKPTSGYTKDTRYTKRCEFIAKHTQMKADKCIVKDDFEARTPSQAAGYVLGASVSGWKVWKTKDGRKLEDIYKEVFEESQ